RHTAGNYLRRDVDETISGSYLFESSLGAIDIKRTGDNHYGRVDLINGNGDRGGYVGYGDSDGSSIWLQLDAASKFRVRNGNFQVDGTSEFLDDVTIDNGSIFKSYGNSANRTIFELYGYSDSHHLDLEYGKLGPNSTTYSFKVNDGNNLRDIGIFNYNDNPFIFCDASTERVGVATTSPSEKLEVDGNIRASGEVVAYADSNLDLSNIYTYEVEGSSSNDNETITPDAHKNKLQLRVIRNGQYYNQDLSVNLDNLTGNLNIVEGTIYLHSDEDSGGQRVLFKYKGSTIETYSGSSDSTEKLPFKFIYDNELDEFINVY
ncbi:MAG: hypothetical protein ACLFUH_06610, partial [Bacteroidales bacterium]